MTVRITPFTVFESEIETGETGLVGTIAWQLVDADDGTVIAASTADIVENPTGSGVYVATRTSPADVDNYIIVWGWPAAGFDPNTVTIEDLVVLPAGASGDTYASVTELARILKIRTPTADQTAAMERVLLTATGEIDSEVDLADDADPLAGWQLALAAEVNLERAVEHWQQQELPFGILGIGDTGAVYTAKDSWSRHALKLQPLKDQWGLA